MWVCGSRGSCSRSLDFASRSARECPRESFSLNVGYTVAQTPPSSTVLRSVLVIAKREPPGVAA